MTTSPWTSARRILAILAGVAFIILVAAYVVRGQEYSIGPDAITAVIVGVYGMYFQKARNGTENGNGNGEAGK